MTDETLTTPEPRAEPDQPSTGFKSPRNKTVTQRTQQRTKRKRKPYSKTLARLKLAEKALTPKNGRLAVEEMDVEIERFEKLMTVLYPWDKNGTQIEGKSVQAFYWAAEMRRDYLALRAPFQTPRLSAIAMLPAGQGAKGRVTEVNVTILNERGEREFTDANEANIIEGEVVDSDEEAA